MMWGVGLEEREAVEVAAVEENTVGNKMAEETVHDRAHVTVVEEDGLSFAVMNQFADSALVHHLHYLLGSLAEMLSFHLEISSSFDL